MKILVEIPDEKIGEYMKLYSEAAREAAYENGDAFNAFNWIHDELGYGSQPTDSPYSARPGMRVDVWGCSQGCPYAHNRIAR